MGIKTHICFAGKAKRVLVRVLTFPQYTKTGKERIQLRKYD